LKVVKDGDVRIDERAPMPAAAPAPAVPAPVVLAAEKLRANIEQMSELLGKPTLDTVRMRRHAIRVLELLS
jgi:hypothetical protein